MDLNSASTLFRIVAFAAIVALIYYLMRKRRPAAAKTNPELESRIMELKTQGATEEQAQLQAIGEFRSKMMARQKKTSFYMGLIWIVFGLVFFLQAGKMDITSIALIALGALQVLMSLLMRAKQ